MTSKLTVSLCMAAALVLGACAAPAPAVNAPPPPTAAEPQPAATDAPADAPAEAATGGKFRVWKQFGDGDDKLLEILKPWAEQNNVEIELTSGIEDMAKIIAAITGGDPPDLLILSSSDDVGTWAREKLVIPLDDVAVSQKISVDDVFPGALAACRYFGQLYCLPWGTDVYALFWNKALFKEAGLDPEKPPQTLEELAEYADKLTKTDADGNITQIGFLPDFSWSHLDAYSLLFGGSFYNEDGTQVTINSPEFVKAMEWQRQFYAKHGFDKIDKFRQGFGEYSSPQAGFNAGKVAMQLEGEWQPKFIREAGVTDLDYGVAAPPPPADNPERAGTVVVGGTVMAIPTGVKNADLSASAFAFLQSPQALADFMVFNSNLPTTKSAAQDPRFREDPKFAVFMDLLAGPNARSHARTPINSEVGAAVSEAEEKSFRDPSFDIQAFMDAKVKELQPALDKALGK